LLEKCSHRRSSSAGPDMAHRAERARSRAARRHRTARARVQSQATLLSSRLPARRAAAVAHASDQMAVVATALALCHSGKTAVRAAAARPLHRRTSLALDLNAIEPFDAWLITVSGLSAIVIAIIACSSLSSPPWPTAATAARPARSSSSCASAAMRRDLERETGLRCSPSLLRRFTSVF